MNATLGELISPAPTIRCGESEYPVLSMTMHDGIVLQSDRFNKRLASADTSNYKVVKRGQLVIGFPINEGVIYPQKTVDAGIMSPAYNVWNIDQTAVDIDYLEYCLHSPASMNYYASKLRGSTARRRSMPTEHLLELPIPLPSLSTQRCITAILDKAQSLISVRREQIAVLEKLAKDLFVEMFVVGKEYEVKVLSDVSDVIGGLTKNTDKRSKNALSYPFLRVANVKFNGFDLSEIHEIKVHERELKKSLLKKGDLLFVEGNGSLEHIGKVAIWNGEIENCLHQNHLIKARFYEGEMAPQYAMYYFMLPEGRRQIVSKSVTTSGLHTLSVGKVEGLTLPVPPWELQKKFAATIAIIEAQKARLTTSLAELETLYKSLNQRAFAGELFSD